MEKRRRARINNCLNELKTLILDAMKKDVSIIHTDISPRTYDRFHKTIIHKQIIEQKAKATGNAPKNGMGVPRR